MEREEEMKSSKTKLTALTVVGAPLAATAMMSEAQAAQVPTFKELCGTTIGEDTTVVSGFSDTLSADCVIDFSDDHYLLVEGGDIDAYGFGIHISSNYSSDITFHNVNVSNAWDFKIFTEGSEDIYGNPTGNVTFKGSKNNKARLEVGDSIEIDANGDVLLKWADLSKDGSGIFYLDVSSDDFSIALIENWIGDDNACVYGMSLDAETSILVRDNDIWLCESGTHSFDVQGTSDGELLFRGNDFHLDDDDHQISIDMWGSNPSVAIIDNTFSASGGGADDSLSVYAYAGSVIYKGNDFDGLDVDTYGGPSCQDKNNSNVGNGGLTCS
jgi:hypothetical protein